VRHAQTGRCRLTSCSPNFEPLGERVLRRADRPERWLVIGHGSVGSFLAERFETGGGEVFVLDPAPRVPIRHGVRIDDPAAADVEFIVSCVPAPVAEEVPSLLAEVGEEVLLFDWNTTSPTVKRRIAAAVRAPVIDVALLDSLDTTTERPILAISGGTAEHGATILEKHHFDVSVVGETPGEAAAIKHVRSIFMKALEALVLEYASIAAGTEHEQVVRRSLEKNLGERFVKFMGVLLMTNRIHAERRSHELEDAIETFAIDGSRPQLAEAAAAVLRRAAEVWRDDDGPPVDARAEELALHLRSRLWRDTVST
jgi:3-hydroxyisobutyrate dehydrogenase-like beta-hydroxyacid dehydrogenase